ncbi:MAG TPA: hypothetical protein VN700_09180 [Vicinamibacterales bacterium]|nr:hypothetical protein [Vicinamibacterales bacterium]
MGILITISVVSHYARRPTWAGLAGVLVTMATAAPASAPGRQHRSQSIQLRIDRRHPFADGRLVQPAVRVEGSRPLQQGLALFGCPRAPGDPLTDFAEPPAQSSRG